MEMPEKRSHVERLPTELKKLGAQSLKRHWTDSHERRISESVNAVGKKGLWVSLGLIKEGLKEKKITILADSGSAWSLISSEYSKYAQDIKPVPKNVILVSATGTPIRGAGVALFKIRLGDTYVTTDMFIVDSDVQIWPYTIIGLSLLQRLDTQIDLKNMTMTFFPGTKLEDKSDFALYASHIDRQPDKYKIDTIYHVFQQAVAQEADSTEEVFDPEDFGWARPSTSEADTSMAAPSTVEEEEP